MSLTAPTIMPARKPAITPSRALGSSPRESARVGREGRATTLARRFENCGLKAIVYTDIKRDGMETGVNIEATRALAEAVRVPVIASGGVASIKDIEKLKANESRGICGVIIGRALYTGAIKLEDAIKAAAA